MSGGEFSLRIYDRQGNRISMERWMELKGEPDDYYRVASDHVGDYHVSTVWLGLDHGWHGVAPLIFETMVFREATGGLEFDCQRYSTEEEALAGHHETLTLVRATTVETFVAKESELPCEANSGEVRP